MPSSFSRNPGSEIGAPVGAAVSYDHFGSAFENRGQSLNDEAGFVAITKRLGLPSLRFPGGTQTENYFDPSNPENPAPTAIFANPGGSAEFVPLSQFIKFTAENQIQSVMVLPTWRYFDPATRMIMPEAEAIIKKFVTDLLNGNYGGQTVKAFEIGNEWFNKHFTWSPAEFAQLQKTMTVWVHEAIAASDGKAARPAIWIQSNQEGQQDHDRNGVNDNREIFNAFTSGEFSFVDGVVDHFYQPIRGASPLDDIYFSEQWVPKNRIARLAGDGFPVLGANAIDVVVTEWNIRADRGEQGPLITGMERAPLFLRLFSEMLEAGVSEGNVFTVQALGESNSTLGRKGESGLTPTGLLFEMMKNALPGTRLLDPSRNGHLERADVVLKDVDSREVGYRYTYSSSNRTVVYFSSAVGSRAHFELDADKLMPDGYTVRALKLRPIGFDPLDDRVDAEVVSLSFRDLDGVREGDGTFDFYLRPYETIQIEIYVAPSITLVGKSLHNCLIGGLGADTLIGAGGNDTLFGNRGADYLAGLGGADILRGGAGNDTQFGGADNDILWGEDGSDRLFGEHGRDQLEGGAGDDLLFGGAGDDTMGGGDGNDWMTGGDGDDYLAGRQGADTLLGGVGIDTLLGGAGNDYLSGQSDHDLLFGADGDDTLLGCDGDDIVWGMAGNDLLHGGSGEDQIEGGDGNDRMTGGLGNDTMGGGEGSDLMLGESGWDYLAGRTGNDTMGGGAGNDTVLGGDGNDWMRGGAGDDFLAGGNGRDTIMGDAGTDTLDGGVDNDWMTGGLGHDCLLGAAGDDTIMAGAGNDSVWGGLGYDLIYGEDGNDRIEGSQGNDTLGGGTGSDTLIGGDGADVIVGGWGADHLWGGTGADRFVFATGHSLPGAGADILVGFERSLDLLDMRGMDLHLTAGGFTGAAGELTTFAVAAGLMVVADLNGDRVADFAIQVTGVASLSAADFLF